MSKPLSFRPIGKAKYFGNQGDDFANFLKKEYGKLPVVLSINDIPKLEDWLSKESKGGLGTLIAIIKRYKIVQVGYFDV